MTFALTDSSSLTPWHSFLFFPLIVSKSDHCLTARNSAILRRTVDQLIWQYDCTFHYYFHKPQLLEYWHYVLRTHVLILSSHIHTHFQSCSFPLRCPNKTGSFYITRLSCVLNVHANLILNCMENSPSSQANGFAAVQETLGTLWNRRFHYHGHYSWPPSLS